MVIDPLIDFLGKLAGKGAGAGGRETGTGMPSLLQELGSKVQLENAGKSSWAASLLRLVSAHGTSLRLEQGKGEPRRTGCFCLLAT